VEFNVQNESDEIHGSLTMGKSDTAFLALTLEEGIQRIYSTYKSGILSCNDYSMGISQVESSFRFFDSHKSGENGLANEEGKAALIHFDCTKSMANHVRNIYGGLYLEFILTPIEKKRQVNENIQTQKNDFN